MGGDLEGWRDNLCLFMHVYEKTHGIWRIEGGGGGRRRQGGGGGVCAS